VVKVSAVPDTATWCARPPWCSDSQELLAAFQPASCERDFIAVVRFQGPQANGMPELHKLTPPLAVLQDQGFQGGAGHRRPHERRLGQGALGHPPEPGGAGRRAAEAGASPLLA
jgi:hypothetical protein